MQKSVQAPPLVSGNMKPNFVCAIVPQKYMDSLLSFLSSLRKNVSFAHTKRGNRDINAAKRGKHTNFYPWLLLL